MSEIGSSRTLSSGRTDPSIVFQRRMKKDIYKIKINQPQPSNEDIAKHKDFDTLLQQFKETTPEPEAVVEESVESPQTPIRRLVCSCCGNN